VRVFRGIFLYEVLSIGGVWNLIIFGGLLLKKYRTILKNQMSWMWWMLIVLVLIQALLSYELARMFYLLTPLLAVVVALLFDMISSDTNRNRNREKPAI